MIRSVPEDTRAMHMNVVSIGRQMLHVRLHLDRRPVQVALAVLAIATILSIVLAPDASVSAWDWTRLLVVAALGAYSVLIFAAASDSGTSAAERQSSLAGAGLLVAIALLLNLTFSFGTAVVFSIGITLVTLAAALDRADRSAWAMTGTLLVAVPWWVWSALDAWTWELLVLIPIAAIGIVSDGHMRAAAALPSTISSPLSARAHRFGSWLGVLGAALIALAFGLLTGVDRRILMLGVLGAVALVALDAVAPSSPGSSRRSVNLIDTALVWLALCWIVSL